ncbi:hypothetical protein CLU79DRAFT_732397 [Phycomyces nitens]|nr:hypothetical protein CLU79DRAFT_732397 [Phycomyces nitens]
MMDDSLEKSSSSTDVEDSDDSDVENVEELMLDLSRGLDNDERLQRRLSQAPRNSKRPTNIKLPDTAFAYPATELFSPGTRFLKSTLLDQRMSHGKPPNPLSDQDNDVPITNVRLMGSTIISDPLLSPMIDLGNDFKAKYNWNGPNRPKNEKAPVATSADVSPLEKERPRRSTIDVLPPQPKGYEPFSLRPPPQVLKSRRASRNGLPASEKPNFNTTRRERASSRSQGTNTDPKNSSSSAVSPRFMALRKLSEAGMLPCLSSLAKGHTLENYETFQNQLLQRIDEAIETQVQSNIRQILWKASESHMDARRFWEDQKNEMFEFGASLVKRLETHISATKASQKPLKTEGDPNPNQELETLRRQQIDLENEVNVYRMKHIGLQRQIFEMDLVKERNSELEKQYDWIRERNAELENHHADTRAHLNRISVLEAQIASLNQARSTLIQIDGDKSKLDEIVSRNLGLEAEAAEHVESKKALVSRISELEAEASKNQTELNRLSSRNQQLETELESHQKELEAIQAQYEMDKKPRSDKLDKEDSQELTKSKEWADMMASEDERKKRMREKEISEEATLIWFDRYQEIVTKYDDICARYEKLKGTQKSGGEKTLKENGLEKMKSKLANLEDENKRLRQIERVNRIQMNHMQQELDQIYRGDPQTKPRNSTTKTQEEAPQPRKERTPKVHQKKTDKPSPRSSPLPSLLVPPGPAATCPESHNKKDESGGTKYVTEDGLLTFTTEINGQLSQYTIRLPQGGNNTNNTSKQRPKSHMPVPKGSRALNPNAMSWSCS